VDQYLKFVSWSAIDETLTKRDLCINRNNHHKPTFHPLGDFSSDTQQSSRRVNSALTLVRTRFKEITNWAKIDFCQSSLFSQPLKTTQNIDL
jgi:hypothetical protein